MKKFIIALTIVFAGLFSTSCAIDNTALVGEWDTVVMQAKGLYQGTETINYDILQSQTKFLWKFTENFIVSVDVTTPKKETTSFSAPFIYKPSKQTLTFLVATCSNFTLVDNVVEFDMEISGDLMNKFLPELESYDNEKQAYSIKVNGGEYLVDKACIHCKLVKVK